MRRHEPVKNKSKWIILLLVFIFVILLISHYLSATDEIVKVEGKSEKEIEIKEVKGGVYYNQKCFVPTGRESCAPQYIIAGAMKCGTTSMFSYLIKHPEVLPLRRFSLDPKDTKLVVAEKEVRFFNDPNYRQLVKEFGEKTAFHYYLDLFDEIPPPSIPLHPDPEVELNRNFITGEATPMYICQFGVAQRIFDVLPFTKIILLLRNPVDRAYSEYWFRKSLSMGNSNDDLKLKQNGITHHDLFRKCILHDFEIMELCELTDFSLNPTLDSAAKFHRCYHETVRKVYSLGPESDECNDSSSPFSKLCITPNFAKYCPQFNAGNSLYYTQLYEWFQVFPRDNIKVYKSENFYSEPSKVMEDLSTFLHISPFNWSNATERTYNIVNPLRAGDREVVTNAGGKKGLQIGAGDVSEYPEIDPSLKRELEALFQPFNILLSKLVGNDEFINWN